MRLYRRLLDYSIHGTAEKNYFLKDLRFLDNIFLQFASINLTSVLHYLCSQDVNDTIRTISG